MKRTIRVVILDSLPRAGDVFSRPFFSPKLHSRNSTYHTVSIFHIPLARMRFHLRIMLLGTIITLGSGVTLAAPISVSSYSYGANPESQPQPTNFQSGLISDVDNLKLTDGLFATGGWNDGRNVGFRNDTDNGLPQPRVTFDLGAAYDVSTIHIWTVTSFLEHTESVTISSSTDGVSFSATTVTVDPIVWTGGFTNSNLRRASIDVSALPGGRFFQVDIFDKGQWMMINEVEFAGSPSGPDLTPPTLASSDIVDDRGGSPVNENTQVIYTLTFSEDIDHTSVDATDFGNAGTSTINIGAITEISPGVFTVAVTPTAAGTLQFQVNAGAIILDVAGNAMDTDAAILDDTIIDVVVVPPDTTKPTPDPMTFAVLPYATSESSIAMVATTATDEAGVEYYFTETSGNPGGADSGWQANPAYEDAGLTGGLTYTYTVTARDLSANHNTTDPSAPASAIAQTPIVPPVITAPTSRHIVQRTEANVGTIEIEGTYSVGTPDAIEARAVVMNGPADNGTTTAWQTIDASPAEGTFAGSLGNVPAGGWYQIEVRGVFGTSPSEVAILEKVGVGDIFVTAGQSNAANHSPGGYVPGDDRVSARTSATGSTWVHATDPIPIASGNGGSVWPRLGDQLAATLDIPIGFVAVGVGGSQVSSWVPGTGNYNNRLRPAVQSFPVQGFRAILWHQGESDSIAAVSATTHASRLNSMISQSRVDAGWGIPWYIAEASWHSSSSHASQEGVVAGQRLTIHGDPLVFFGESTDDMHLKGSPLHFDVARQNERVQQYNGILAGSPSVHPLNGHFEDNQTPAVTGLGPLADGASETIVITDPTPRRPIGWRILSASGLTAADGANGYYNPATGTYAGAVDSVNGGVLPNMSGKHVALLDGGSAGNYFLQSTRSHAEPNTTYTLTVAIGVRDDPSAFGTARLDITSNGVVVASAVFDKAALDTLHGSDSAGSFTNASVSWATGNSVPANHPLAFRIVKEGGEGTVLDFDNVRFTAAATNDFQSWISNPALGLDPAEQDFHLDPDNDGLPNGIEAWFGTHPGEWNAGFTNLSTTGNATIFSHPANTTPISDVSGSYQWSPNMADWYDSGSGPVGGPVVTIIPVTEGASTTVTATSIEAVPRLFLRAVVTRN